MIRNTAILVPVSMWIMIMVCGCGGEEPSRVDNEWLKETRLHGQARSAGNNESNSQFLIAGDISMAVAQDKSDSLFGGRRVTPNESNRGSTANADELSTNVGDYGDVADQDELGAKASRLAMGMSADEVMAEIGDPTIWGEISKWLDGYMLYPYMLNGSPLGIEEGVYWIYEQVDNRGRHTGGKNESLILQFDAKKLQRFFLGEILIINR